RTELRGPGFGQQRERSLRCTIERRARYPNQGRSGRDVDAVTRGLARTARVITAAAAIMVTVFASNLLAPENSNKEFGLGLAVAVLIDATVVRMVLVPALMEVLGEVNWWLPRPLVRLLPEPIVAE